MSIDMFIEPDKDPRTDPPGEAGELAMLTGFLVLETRADAPLLPLRLFRLRTLAGSNAVGFLLGASFYSYIFIGTLYLQRVLGFRPVQTGVAYLALAVPVIAASPIAARLVTRFGPRRDNHTSHWRRTTGDGFAGAATSMLSNSP